MVTTKQLQAYYQRVHGIAPGTPYDPYLHENVPALAFGTVPYDPRDIKGAPLHPLRDLVRGSSPDEHLEAGELAIGAWRSGDLGGPYEGTGL